MVKEWIVEWFLNNSTVKNEDMNSFLEKNYLEEGLIDSFGFLGLIGSCEEEFSISFSDDDFSNDAIFTMEGLIKIINDKI